MNPLLRKNLHTKLVACLLCFCNFPVHAKDTHHSLEGNWVMRYSCEKVSQDYKALCLQGEGDVFALYDLTQSGHGICGHHVATGKMTRRVDQGDPYRPSIFGIVQGKKANVLFRSSLADEEMGEATIIEKNGNLIWHVIRPLNGENYFPNDAILKREARHESSPMVNCENSEQRYREEKKSRK